MSLLLALTGGDGGLTATLNVTEAADTIASTGAVAVGAAASITNGADTVSGAASVIVGASASIAGSADTASGLADVQFMPVTATLAVTEAPDTLSATMFNPDSSSVNYYGSGKQAGNRSLIDQVLDKYAAIDRARKNDKPISADTKPDPAFENAEKALKDQKAKADAARKEAEAKAKRQVEEIKAKAAAEAKAKAEMKRKAFPPMEMPHTGEAKRLRDAAIEDEHIMRLMATMLLED